MPYSIDTTRHPSPNHESRDGAQISSIVIHSCEGKLPSPRVSSLPWLCNPQPAHPDRRVSCHYYICRNAEIYQLVADSEAAWHAGNAQPAFVNAHSLGIELEHRAGMNWPPVQRDALAWLLRRLMAAYHIDAAHVETHGQIAIAGPYDRKHDPSDWKYADFRAFVGALSVAPTLPVAAYNPARYRVRSIGISQLPTGGPPWAGTMQPGDLVEIDIIYTWGYAHLTNNLGFVRMADLEPAGNQ